MTISKYTLSQHDILNSIAKSIAGKSFDEFGGFTGMYKRMKDEGVKDYGNGELSDGLNFILSKKRQLEQQAA